MLRKQFFYLIFLLSATNDGAYGQQPVLVLPVAHTGPVHSAKFSPDGNKVVTASSDGTAKIWDTRSGKLLFDLNARDGEPGPVSFSNDGNKLLTIHRSARSKTRVWDTRTGSLLVTLSVEPRGSINYAVFSPGGSKIATGSHDLDVRIWNSDDGKLIATLRGHRGFLLDAAFSTDEKHITTLSTDSTKRTWSLPDGKLQDTRIVDLEPPIDEDRPVLSPGGQKLLTRSSDGKTIHVSETRTGKFLLDLRGHTDYVTSIAFSPDGKKIITGSADRSARIWDLNSGRMLADLKGYTYNISQPFYSQDSKSVGIISEDGTVRIWNIPGGRMMHTLAGHTGKINVASFSGDGKKVLTAADDSTAKIWDVETERTIHTLKGHTGRIRTAAFAPDFRSVITGSADLTARVWDVQTGAMLAKLSGHTKEISAAGFTSDGSKIITTSLDKTARTWHTPTGRLIAELSGHKAQVNTFGCSPDGKRMATASSDNTARLWDIENGALLADLNSNENTLDVRNVYFSPDGKRLITTALNGSDIWDGKTGKWLGPVREGSWFRGFSPDGMKTVTIESNDATIYNPSITMQLARLTGHKSYINAAVFSPDNRFVVTTSADQTARIWDVVNGKLLYTFFAVGNSDFFAITPGGYYQCSPGAAKLLHYITRDKQLITFEQLDVQYNRPDKVLESIGNTDTALISSYRNAWQKRVKKLRIDTTAFREGYQVPSADFPNRDAIGYEQEDKTIKLHFKGTDSTYELERFNLWVNETPVFGQRGINLKDRKSGVMDTTLLITLSRGQNRIEASVTNINGMESYRVPLFVNHTSRERETEMTRFIGIGIDRFADSRYDLQYSAKDIRDLSLSIIEKCRCEIIIDTLFNENVTVENIAALKKKLLQSGVNDKVIIAYSGHGMLSQDFDYYLSTYAVNFNKPEENGLPYSELENLLDSIPARKKLLLIDACHSGEVDKEDLVTLNASSDSLIKGLKPVAYKKDGQLGLQNSFELMQSLFVNVGKSTGATVISAAAGTQFALERNDLKNGVFTYSILEAIKRYPTMKISELKKIVGERVEQLTKGLQKPTSRNETIAVDWEVW